MSDDEPVFSDEAPEGEEEAGLLEEEVPSDPVFLDADPSAGELAPPVAPLRAPAVEVGEAEPAAVEALPERRRAKAYTWESQPETLPAICPACEAKNPWDAKWCGRCGESLRPAVPAGGGGGGGFGVSVRVQEEARGPVWGDRGALIPDEVRARMEASAVEVERRRVAREERRLRLRQQVRWSLASAFVVWGFVLSGLVTGGWGLFFAVVSQGALGWFAGEQIVRQGGGRLRGQFVVGGAAVGLVVLSTLFGGSVDGIATVSFLLFASCTLLLGLSLGQMLGLWVEQELFGEGF